MTILEADECLFLKSSFVVYDFKPNKYITNVYINSHSKTKSVTSILFKHTSNVFYFKGQYTPQKWLITGGSNRW